MSCLPSRPTCRTACNAPIACSRARTRTSSMEFPRSGACAPRPSVSWPPVMMRQIFCRRMSPLEKSSRTSKTTS